MWPFKKSEPETEQCEHRNSEGKRCLRHKDHVKFLDSRHRYELDSTTCSHNEPDDSGLVTGLVIGSMLGNSGSAAALPTVADDTPAFSGFGGGASGGAGAGGSYDAPSSDSSSSCDTSSSDSSSSSSDCGSSDSGSSVSDF
jgi:hypothetical protein